MRKVLLYVKLALTLLSLQTVYSQDNAVVDNKIDKITSFPSRFFDKVGSRYSNINSQLTQKTEKYIRRLEKQERILKRRLAKIDASKAQQLFASTEGQYSRLTKQITNPPALPANISSGEYQAFTDSIKTTLTFLSQNTVLSTSKEMQGKIKNSLSQLNQLQSKFNTAEDIKALMRQRQQQLKEALSRYTQLPKSVNKAFNNYQREAYYYSNQIKEYKDAFNKQPEKLVQKGLTLLNKVPAYRQFMEQHSALSGIFRMPDYGNAVALAGLQTRSQVSQLIQTQLTQAGPNGTQVLQQSLQAAQAQLNQFKNKIRQFGQGNHDMDMPKGFKPNSQRTKSLWKRLEYGTNLQTQKNNFFPTTTDLGLSVGYKINDKSTVGVGASYKLGWGRDIKHIVITRQGMSLRSYLDVKLKGSFYASGGFEFNYQPLNIDSTSSVLASMHWNEFSTWQKSSLIGISKIISIKSKFFKKTKLQLLWDFLSYQQLPRTQPLKFRVGYNF